MTAHELQYCRHLRNLIEDLYIERAAMSVCLDLPAGPNPGAQSIWRSRCRTMTADAVFRSAVVANHAALFDRLDLALTSQGALAALRALPRDI